MNEYATCVVGIDVSKRKLDIALLTNSKIKSKVFDNTVIGHRELVQWLLERGAEQQRTHICMEATGPYSEAVAIALVESDWHISVVNPARIKGLVDRRSKCGETYDRICGSVACGKQIYRFAGLFDGDHHPWDKLAISDVFKFRLNPIRL